MKPGRFISLEGIDGAGKSSQLAALSSWLSERGSETLVTREPGGTGLAERLRELLLHHDMDALTEALLVFAARRDHLTSQIEPALARGVTVICDRFTDASLAYQGGGRGLDRDILFRLADWVQQGRRPDLTLWFDTPAQVAADRRARVREADRFESQDLRFFERVRAVYAELANAEPARIARIDASGNTAEVWARVESALCGRGW